MSPNPAIVKQIGAVYSSYLDAASFADEALRHAGADDIADAVFAEPWTAASLRDLADKLRKATSP